MKEIYLDYAKGVQDGSITACKYIKQATKRYLEWFNKYDFREEKVDKVISFIRHLKHFTGKHNNKPFELLPFQVWIIANVFGFYHKGTNKRVVNYVYLELGRKNGKTAFAAAIALYMLVADGESGSEVEIVANSAKQAKICFDMSSNYLASIDKRGKHFKRYRDKIKFDATKSFLQVLSSDASGNDGYNSHCFILDECHEQPNSKLWDVMVSSQGMRESPLGVIITTAGFNRFGFCYGYRQTCTEILAGLKQNDAQFAAIYTLDEGDSWQDPNNWLKANPSMGVTVKKDYLEQQILNAKNNSSLEVGVRTKNLNEWVSSQDIWLSNDLLLQYTQPIRIEDYKGSNCYMGVDLASVSDLTALAVMIPFEDKFLFKCYYYLPQSALSDNSNAELYKEWKRKGFLTITDGNVTDYDYILNDILRISETVYIDKIAYDSYNATQWAINATEQGLPLQPYSQALWSFNRPTKEIERLIKSGKIILDNNEITRWCFANCMLKWDSSANCKPIKGGNEQNKIDGVIAIIEALGIFLETPQYNNIIGVV